jgi:hypothetical protein
VAVGIQAVEAADDLAGPVVTPRNWYAVSSDGQRFLSETLADSQRDSRSVTGATFAAFGGPIEARRKKCGVAFWKSEMGLERTIMPHQFS